MYGDLEEDELGAPRTVGDAIRRSRARDEEPDERTRVLLEELARSPEERRTLFAETPVGPTVHSHPDGTSTRTPGDSDAETRALEALAGRRAAPEEAEPRTVALNMEPMRITAEPETPPMEEADFDPEADGTRAALEALLAEQNGEAEYPVERPEDSVLRSDQMQGAGEADRVNTSAPQDPALGGRTDFDAMASVPFLEDGSIDGNPGFPAFDDYEEGPNAEIYGAASDADPTMPARPGASMPSVDDESGFWGSATDADPELPGRVSPGAASIPGYPADDDEAAEAARGIDDDESAEAFGGLELVDPRGPRAPKSLDELLASDEERPDFAAGTNRAAQIAALQMIVDGMAQVGSAMSGGRGYSPFTSGASDELMAAGAATDAGTAREASARRSDDLARSRMESQERIASMRATDEPSDLERAREERLRAAEERRGSIAERRLDLAERGLTERGERTAEETAAAERRRDPASEDSDRARQLLAREIETLSPAIRESLSAVDLSGLNAEEADAYRDDLPMLIRDRLGRGRGGAGGGGGGSTRAALRQALVASGMTEEEADLEIDAMGTTGARRSLADRRRASASGGEESSNELISGTGIVPTVELEGGEAARVRGRLTAYRDGWSALDEIERLVERYGAGRSVVDPSVRAELEPANMTLIAMVAEIQHSGTLNSGERPIIEASLPNVDAAGMTLGRYAGALRGWRTRISGAAASAIAPIASGEENRAALDQWLRTGEGRTTRRGGAAAESGSSSAPAASFVRVRGPDGTIRRIPRDRIPRGGVPEGFEVVE